MLPSTRSTIRRLTIVTLCLFSAVIIGATSAFAQSDDQGIETQRLAQTGLKFLSLSVSPRAAAMGSAVTATEWASSVAMSYNPAGMARMENAVHVSLGQVQWIANTKYNVGSLAFNPAGGRYGTFGVSVRAVDYPEFLGTIRSDTPSGFTDTGNFSPSALSVGVGYARTLTDRFSVGGNVKYARQALGESVMSREGDNMTRQSNSISTAVFDLGVLYRTGFRSLNFAVSIRNFARELTYAEESFELPLTFNIGTSIDLMDFTAINSNTHSFLLSLDARRPRDYSEQVKLGGEYVFSDLLALRAGYIYPSDEQGVSFGGGINMPINNLQLSADYAYSQLGIFGNVHRFGLQFGL